MKHFLIYHGEVTMQGANNLETLLSEAVQKGAPEITVCICSGGGNVAAGIGAFNFMRMLSIPIKTHAFGLCGSIAATMFMAGTERTSCPTNLFLLHAASYTSGARAGQISADSVLISKPFQEVAEWDDSLIAKYFSSTEEFHLTAEQAQNLRITTSIANLRFAQEDSVVHVSIPQEK